MPDFHKRLEAEPDILIVDENSIHRSSTNANNASTHIHNESNSVNILCEGIKPYSTNLIGSDVSFQNNLSNINSENVVYNEKHNFKERTKRQVIMSYFLIIVFVFMGAFAIKPMLSTNLPCETSIEEIIYRIFVPYITKEKISKTQ